MVGKNGKDVTTYLKPNADKEYPVTNIPTNDNFRDYKLAPQWEWNHNPDNSNWSLVKRPGYLRLNTANVTDSLPKAKNTLTQRILGFPANQNLSYGTIKMHINKMVEGDVAGLTVFQDPYAFVGIKVINGLKKIIMLNSGTKTQEVEVAIPDSVVYLRSIVNYSTSQAVFYYSTDNKTYTQAGSLNMQYNLSVFVGNRFGIFNYATTATGGYVDVDWFSTEKDFSEDSFFDNSFTGYSESALTISKLTTENTTVNLLTGSTQSITINAVYEDGHTGDVTLSATYTNSNPAVLSIKNGLLIAKANGDATITVSYQGGMGEAKSLTLNVHSTYFPLTTNLFNPSIYAAGTFDEKTGTLVTGQYGFGGWSYSSGIDLSGYKYLVAKLGADNTSSISFRIFDENSYWSTAAQYNFGTSRRVVVTLANMIKSGTTKLNPGHIYIVGFWSMGNKPIVIENVYLTNSDTYEPPTGINEILYNDPNEMVDVYTIMGIKIRTQIKREQAIKELSNGLYIVGKEKIIIVNHPR